MKKAVLKVERDDDFEDQLIDPEKSEAKDTKVNRKKSVVKISMPITEEYKYADPERRIHMWYMFRGLRNEFDKIDRDSENRVCGIGCCAVKGR